MLWKPWSGGNLPELGDHGQRRRSRHSGQSYDAVERRAAIDRREREVLQLVAEGKSSKEIGVILHIAVPTVETHRRQIVEKLNLRTIAELTKYAIREGLTSTER